MSLIHKSLNELTMQQEFTLEELLDVAVLSEMTSSFEQLFGVAVRLYSAGGSLLADTRTPPRFYACLDETKPGRQAVQAVILAVRSQVVKVGQHELIPCPSGGSYLISAIAHEGKVMGKIILGPFLSPDAQAPPESTWSLVMEASHDQALLAWQSIPKLEAKQVMKLDQHLRNTLDLLIFSGLKAHLASSMHMNTVQENFRELSDKNKKLQVAYDRLKELDRLKSNFLATVSHELRTPLTSIIGYSEMMIEGISGEINEEQREFLNTIHEKGEQLLELIKSLLDLSKLESGTMSLRRAPVDCGHLVEQVVKTLTPAALKRGVKLVAEVEVGVPALQGDADRLRQVLNNLTENALKFTAEGGMVVVSTRNVGLVADDMGGLGGALLGATQRPAIELRVTDTGIGIPESERERVFDAFYQVDSSSTREVGGTGLGLSIVKRLVDAHDGTVRVESNKPRGSSFIVVLPILHRAP